MISWCAQIQDTIIKPGILVDFDVKSLFRLVLSGHSTAGILNLQWQLRFRGRNNPNLFDMKFDIFLCTSFNFFRGFFNFSMNIDNAFLRNTEKKLVKSRSINIFCRKMNMLDSQNFFYSYHLHNQICPKNCHFRPKNDGQKWSPNFLFEIPPCMKKLILRLRVSCEAS